MLELFSPSDLASTILKVGHHGSRTSTSAPFVEVVNPEIAIISCGKRNKFRHPHPATIRKLESCGIKVYRTDINGAVVIKTDGRSVDVAGAK